MTFSPLTLGDSLDLLIDNRGKNPPYEQTGIPVVSGMSVRPGYLDLSDTRFASKETWERWMPHPTQQNDIVLTSEAPLGRVALIRTAEPLVIAQRVFCLRGRRGVLDSRFLYYALQTDRVQGDLQSRATGTTVVGIRQPELRKVVVPAPDYEEQRSIADVLGVIDDKIAANDRVIATAESLMITQAGTSSSRATVAEIATQWKVTLNPEDFESEVAHFSLPAFDEGKMPEICSGRSIKSNKTLISKSCVLMSKLNPRIPRIWDVITPPDQMSIASTEFVALVPNQVRSSLLWASLSDPSVSVDLAANVAGTSGSHQRVKPAELLALQVKDPRALDLEIQRSIADLGAVCHLRRMESSRLKVTRDQLLPLLMSGKVRVRDAEKIVEGVV